MRARVELVDGDLRRAAAALPAGGVAFLNADDPYVSQFGRDFHGKVVLFGIDHPADVYTHAIEDLGARGSKFQLIASGVKTPAELPLLGRHNVVNALVAQAILAELGVGQAGDNGALAAAGIGTKQCGAVSYERCAAAGRVVSSVAERYAALA